MARWFHVFGGVLMASIMFCGLAAGQQAGSADFAFQIPFDGLVEGTAPAELARLTTPAGAEGFVRVQGARFVLSESGRPVRFWATNLCFGGCFPPHDVAERMARRLASLGVNCVRFHHMDMAGYPRGIWANPGGGDFEHTTLHPEALDRLDYLVAQLKKHGVYTNLNLHVSRTYGPKDGFPAEGKGESIPSYGKGVDHFFPRCVEEQKRYARMLLRHVNRYTQNAYAEEPAVAMVEISNEDGLVRTWSAGQLDTLPKAYVEELERQWNEWLRARYASTEALRKAWSEGAASGGQTDLLTAPGVRRSLQTVGDAQARLEEVRTAAGEPAHRITVQEASPISWHVQHLWGPLTVREGVVYVLKMRLRANREDRVSVDCKMNHEPWRNIGLSQNVPVGREWRDHEFYFTVTQDDSPDENGRGGARITLSGLSKEGLQIAFAGVSLRLASVRGLLPDEGLAPARVAWPRRRELAARTPGVRRDVIRFLRDTEVAYWKGMCDYLHEELGVRMPVTGTAVGFTSSYMAAESMDFVDSHAYWQHPRFPGRPWDRDNWFVRNEAMVDDPGGSTIGRLAGRRVFGLPYTVTEYNHPQPHHYQAEGFPLIAAYGSLQAWDGVFQFAYCHNAVWEADHFSSFFDMKADPVKLAVMPACSKILREGLVGPARRVAAGAVPLEKALELLLTRGPAAVDAYAGGVNASAWQDALVGVTAGTWKADPTSDTVGDALWEVAEDGRGVVVFRGSGCAGMIGFCAGRELTAGNLVLQPGPTSLDGFSVVLVSSVEGQDLGEPGRCLITAVSRCYNQDMGWNKERNSVGRNWGTGPTLCEGVPLSLTVRHGTRTARLFPLNADGTRREEVGGVSSEPGVTGFGLGQPYQTLWYELEVGQ